MDPNPLYVVCGLNRLTIAVVEGLVHEVGDADIVVVAPEPDNLYGPMMQRWGRITYATHGLEAALRDDARLPDAACLLALAEDDLDNMRAAVLCHALAPHVPMVVRVFDRLLAQQLEGLRRTPDGRGLGIRRAYSMSTLAAPRFVAAALGEDHLLTMRLGDEVVPVFRLPVFADSPMRAKTVAAAADDLHCTVIAHRSQGSTWQSVYDDESVLAAGDDIVVAGLGAEVFQLAARNSELLHGGGATRVSPGLSPALREGPSRRLKAPTLLPKVALGLSVVLILSMVVIGFAWRKNPLDALYWTFTTAASGAPTDDPPYPAWLKLFAVIPIMAGGALFGVLFSYLASVATAQRLEQHTDRQVARMRNHVVLGGLGTVGYRIERLLSDLGIPTVVIELSPQDKFASAARAPVLPGDIRLPENLERAAIRHAACLIAVTDDDLANLEACLNATKLNPGIRTVARIFDDALADQSERAFGISQCLSASRIAAPAFVDAATDERVLRQFHIDSEAYVGFRLVVTRNVDRGQLDGWRREGVRVVALRRADEPERVRATPGLPDQLRPGDEAVVVGPDEVVRRVAEGGYVEPAG